MISKAFVSLGSISSEKDLKGKARIMINPPPKDRCCECCGRHISELKPFGKAGDPLVGYFEGKLLIKKFRPIGPYDKEAKNSFKHVEKIMEKEGHPDDDPLDWMVKIYGKEKGMKYLYTVYAYEQVGSSWECRDCAVLDADEYFEQLKKIHFTD
ncbi:hypothetical protein KQH27_00385 [bacterium]|nr:hypothetical protein [bacterium]